jgi:hypothetical protein
MTLTTRKGRGRPQGRSRLFLALLAAAACAAVQWTAFPGQWLGAESDDAKYALLSRSLASGRYSLGILPGDPVLGEMTPGWPLLLLPAAALAPDAAAAYQLVSFFWLAACDVLLALFLLPRAGLAGAAALTAAFALNPLVLSRSGVVMPEVPGLAVALGSFLMADRRRPFPGWAAGLLAALAYLIRPGLFPLVFALAAAYWVRGRRRDAAAALAVPAAAWGLWRAWAAGRPGVSDLQEGLGSVAASGWAAWPKIAAANLGAMAELAGRSYSWKGEPGLWALAAAALLYGAAGLGLRRACRPRPPAWALFLGGMLALHAAWPWWYERYLVALLPPLLLAAWLGGRSLGMTRRAGAAAALALALTPLWVQGRAVAARAAAEPPAREAYRFLRALPPEGLVASEGFAADAWYCGRPFVPLPLGDAEAAPQALAATRVRWVFWAGTPEAGESLGRVAPLARALARWEDRLAGPGFRRVWEGPGGAVYEVAAGTKVTDAFP